MNPYVGSTTDAACGDGDGGGSDSSAGAGISYAAMAARLLQDNFLLTALELHTELVESGRELPQLREFFSNPGNFEQHVTRPDTAMHRTPSQATLDSLDLARYSEEGGGGAASVAGGGGGGDMAVLEFELRKAKETINSLRANLTQFADCESSDSTRDRLDGGSLKPHEKRALNFLVNEYLLLQHYKLTSITFSDENPDQDFEDWDDVGLNVPRPCGLIPLYRGEAVAPRTPLKDVGTDPDVLMVDMECQTDAMDEESICVSCQTSFNEDTDWNHEILVQSEEIVLLKRQVLALETDKLNFQKLYDAALASLNSLATPVSESANIDIAIPQERLLSMKQGMSLERICEQPLTCSATENHYGSNASTNSVTPEQFEMIDCEKNGGSLQKEGSSTSWYESAPAAEAESPRRGSAHTLDDTLSLNEAGEWTRLQHADAAAGAGDTWMDSPLPEELKARLLRWCGGGEAEAAAAGAAAGAVAGHDLLRELLATERPITPHAFVTLAADTLLRIVPHTLVSRRCEAAAAVAAAAHLLAAAAAAPERRARLLHLLLTLLKRPDAAETALIADVKVGYTLRDSDVDYVHRVRKFGSPPLLSDGGDDGGEGTAVGGGGGAGASTRARADGNIVVRLLRRSCKDELLAAVRARRGITTADIGFAGPAINVFINEHLTPMNKQLLKRVRDLKVEPVRLVVRWGGGGGGEVLACAAEQLASRSGERRALAGRACLAAAPHLPAELCGSLLPSVAQLMCDAPEPEVRALMDTRVAAVRLVVRWGGGGGGEVLACAAEQLASRSGERRALAGRACLAAAPHLPAELCGSLLPSVAQLMCDAPEPEVRALMDTRVAAVRLVVRWGGGGGGEVLACAAEQLASRSGERRALAGRACLAAAPHLPAELCGSLLPSVAQLMCDAPEPEVRALMDTRVAAVRLVVRWGGGGGGEVLACAAEQLASRSGERRALAGRACLAAAPHLPAELCGSLLPSVAQLMCDAPEPEVRALGLRAAALACPLARHRYALMEGVMLAMVRDPADAIRQDCVAVFAPLLARSALGLGKFSSDLCHRVMSQLVRFSNEGDWKNVIVYLDIFKALAPPMLIYVINVQIVRDNMNVNSDELCKHYQETRLEYSKDFFFDLNCYIVDYTMEPKLLIGTVNKIVKETSEVRWPELVWFLDKIVKELIEISTNSKPLSHESTYNAFLNVFSAYCELFGRNFTTAVLKSIFCDIICDLEQKLEKLQPLNSDCAVVAGIFLAAVLPYSDNSEAEITSFLERWVVCCGVCGLPVEVLAVPLKWLASHKPTLLAHCLQHVREIIASSCLSRNGASVRAMVANILCELTTCPDLSEACLDTYLLPAVLSLLHDEDSGVRERGVVTLGGAARACAARSPAAAPRCWAALEAVVWGEVGAGAGEAARAADALASLLAPEIAPDEEAAMKVLRLLCGLCERAPLTSDVLSSLLPGMQLAVHLARPRATFVDTTLLPALRRLEQIDSPSLTQHRQAAEALAASVVPPAPAAAPAAPSPAASAPAALRAAPEAVGRRVTQIFQNSKSNIPNIFKKKS